MSTIKARGNGQPPRTYTVREWVFGYIALILLLPVYAFLWFMARVVKQLPRWAVTRLLRWHWKNTARPEDVRIPTTESIPAYMLRWWKIRRNAFFNIYLHEVFRSDDDKALHDHPWWSFSIVLAGGYFEHTIAEGGVHHKRWFGPGAMQFRRSGTKAHRLQLELLPELVEEEGNYPARELPATTIFITGPTLRRWGFHHSERWVDAYDWDEFLRERGIVSMKMEGYAEQLAKGSES